MVAGEVLEQLSMINFEKSAVPLKSLTLSSARQSRRLQRHLLR